jgi:dihydroxyacid dehydratase/phosphogluconate dehydratase
METEENLRSLPVDGAVLMGGCDKTTPGLLMGAISMNLRAIYLPARPMLRGNWKGQPLGSGTDLWKFWTERCAGTITQEERNEMEGGIARSPGFCMTIGNRRNDDGIDGGSWHDVAGGILNSGRGFQSYAYGG